MNLEGLKYSLFLEDDFLKGILLLFQFFIFNFHSKLNFFVRGFPVPCPPSNFYCVLFSRNERKNSSKFDFCFVEEVTMKKFLQKSCWQHALKGVIGKKWLETIL